MFFDADFAVRATELLPEIILLCAACGVLLTGIAPGDRMRRLSAPLSLVAIGVAMTARHLLEPSGARIGGGLTAGSLAEYVRSAALIFGVLAVVTHWSQPHRDERGEFFAMLLFSLAGLMLTGLSSDLLMLFVALELVSIPAYVVVALSHRGPAALEAGTKYFYLGALAAAITAYGFAFLYGAGGTSSMDPGGLLGLMMADPAQNGHAVAAIGMVLAIGGLCFKIAAFPLHFYVADVYEGAAGPVAGFLGFVPKLAGFVAIIKLLEASSWFGQGPLFWLLWIVAASSMTVGNLLALQQTSIRRMLAYSGVAHAGYMLVGLIAWPIADVGVMGDGPAAVLYYIFVYGIANLAAFTVLSLLHSDGQPCETLRDVAGILRRHPGLAMLLSLAMFTLMGLPPTAGFWGKLALFGSALSTSTTVPHGDWVGALVIVGVVNSAIGAAYYLRVVAACLLYENERPADVLPREVVRFGAALAGALIVIFSAQPNLLLNASRRGSAEVASGAERRPVGAQRVARLSDADSAAADNPADAGSSQD